MLDLTEVPAARLQATIASSVERVAARRVATRDLDPDEARSQVREVVERTAESSSYLDVVDDGHHVGWVWLTAEDDRLSVHDVLLDDADLAPDLVAVLVERARAQGARSIGVGGTPDEPGLLAVAAQPGFHVRATNMVLALDGEIADPGSLELEAMTTEEFDAFVGGQVEGFAAELAASGMDADRALAESSRQMAQLVPAGLESPGMEFHVARMDGQAVGDLWLAVGQTMAFVYDIEVRPDQRRRGHGEAIMNAAALHARDLGHPTLGLNVFAHNPGARALYDKLGYRVTLDYSTLDLTDAG